MIYVPGMGNPNAKLLILGDHPRPVDTELGMPFQGPGGRELDSLLREAGINRSETWTTNVVKYEVPPSPYKKKQQFRTRCHLVGINLDDQIKELHQEIHNINPNCILALGGTALYSLLGKTTIQKHRGSILQSNGNKFVSTYHPAHILHSADAEIKGYWNRYVMLFDFKRAKAQSEYSEYRIPQKFTQIARNSADLYTWYKQYKHKKKVAVDIEAGGTCHPACVGMAFNDHHAMVVPIWDTADPVQTWLLLNEILTSHHIIGQNFKYDDDKLRRIGFKIRYLSDDLLLKSFCISPELPKNLAFNTSVWTEQPYYKDEGMYEGTFEDLMQGCGVDACCTFEINDKMEGVVEEMGLMGFYRDFLMRLHPLYLHIETQGFLVDAAKRDFLIEKYIRWSETLQFEIYKMTGKDLNVNSPKQVSELLYDELKLPIQAGTGEEELTKIINNTKVPEPSKKVCEKILEKRRVDKTIGTYLLGLPDYDGRMRTTFFLALETGRTRTSQLEPPIRPVVEVKEFDGGKKKKEMGLAFQTMTKHGDIGQDLREQFVPDKGEVFLNCDKSQAEARVVFLCADDEDALRDIDERDYHAWTASWFFGGTEQDYSKKLLGYEHPIRFGGKTLRHACHLGAKARTAATSVNTDARKYKINIKITEKQADYAIKIFHQRQPKIRGIFHRGVEEFLKNNNRQLIAPVPYGVNSRIGGIRTFYERWGDELFRQAYSYIPQRAVTDSTKSDALRIRRRIPGIRIILEAHDALLFSIPERHVSEWAAIIRDEMEKPIRFDQCSFKRRDLVIPCDIEIGYDYRNFKKFKDLPERVKPVKVEKEYGSITDKFTVDTR